MKTISLITVYNNKSLVNEMTESAKKQNGVEIDFVLMNNTKKRFASAAQALNYGAAMAKGEVIVFLHQDLEFISTNVLEYIYDYAKSHRWTLLGAAGVENRNNNDNPKLLSAMYEGEQLKYCTLKEPEEVFTLDECIIACHKSCMDKIKFDERLCDGWHLYGADLCLQAWDFADFNVEVLPLDVWHKSHGNADKAYFETQNRLAKKYKKYHKIINTTNGYVYTNTLKRFIQNVYRKIRYKSV